MEKFILASGSQRRIDFLNELGYSFDTIPADINESAKKGEIPREYVKRLAIEKALEVYKTNSKMAVLGADTVCAVGRRILGKPENAKQATDFIKMMSGQSHRVYSAVCLVLKDGSTKVKVVETRIKFRPLSSKDIASYVADESNWKGFAGGYALQSTKGSALIKSMVGSHSSVIGLPLYETQCLLNHI